VQQCLSCFGFPGPGPHSVATGKTWMGIGSWMNVKSSGRWKKGEWFMWVALKKEHRRQSYGDDLKCLARLSISAFTLGSMGMFLCIMEEEYGYFNLWWPNRAHACPVKYKCSHVNEKFCPEYVQVWAFKNKVTLAISGYIGIQMLDGKG
jgi:hypothetical protein